MAITVNNFFTTFKDYTESFIKSYKKGLYALVVALLTFGLERILDKDVFSCPRTGYQAYGIAFFVCPIVMLTLFNWLTVPAEGGVHIWTLCERCWIKPYHRRGDFFSGFLSALAVGMVAPAAWTFLALLDAQHLVCWELGYQFNDNVTDSYLKDRGFGYLTIERYDEKIHEAKAKSHTIAVVFIGVIVVLLCLMIIVRRSCLKPFDPEDRLPSLCHFEELEAFAARDELERLLSDGDEFDQFSSTASLLQSLVIKERIVSLETELKVPETSAKKTHEIKEEIAEFKELEIVLHFWAEWDKLNVKKDLKLLLKDSELNDAKTAYDSRKSKLWDKRKAREDTAKEILKKYETSADGEVSSTETTEVIYQAWLLTRLEQQKIFFDVDKLIERWGEARDEIKRLKQTLEAQMKDGFIECPEIRGRVVASYLMQLYKDQKDCCLTVEQVLEKFRSIYPRVATSDPTLRYVRVDNPMYKHIIDDDGQTSSGENIKVPLLYACEKDWEEKNERDWEKFMMDKHEHSRLWQITGCKNPHCPNSLRVR